MVYVDLYFLSVNELITLPNTNNDLFILPVSFIIPPFECVSFNLSLPAKSTNDILPYFL